MGDIPELLLSAPLNSFGYQVSSHTIFRFVLLQCAEKIQAAYSTHTHSKPPTWLRPAFFGYTKTPDRSFLKMGTFYSFLGTYYGTYYNNIFSKTSILLEVKFLRHNSSIVSQINFPLRENHKQQSSGQVNSCKNNAETVMKNTTDISWK